MFRRALAITLAALVLALCNGCATVRPPGGVRPVDRTLETTGYCKCKKCCGWKRTWYGRAVDKATGKPKKVGVTASGLRAKPGRTIAADTRRYPLGTIMYIPGYGYGRVEDRGSAITQDKIDLYFKSHKKALEWGRQKKTVRIWIRRR